MSEQQAAWRLTGARPPSNPPDEESDEEQQKKNRRRKRKPLPPIDLLGASTPLSAPSYAAAPPHASAFSVPKPRHHHYAVADDSVPQSTTPLSGSSMHLSPSAAVNGMSPIPQSQQPLALKRATSPMLHSPLAASTSSSRTVTVCCCIQIQFEGGNRRCSRTVLWLIMVTALICAFSVLTVSLSYYSVDIFQPRMTSRGGSDRGSVLKRLNSAFGSPFLGENDAVSWAARNSLPDDADRVTLDFLLPILAAAKPTLASNSIDQFVSAATRWAKQELASPSAARNVLVPFGNDFVSARALFPDAEVVFVINTWACPSMAALKQCDQTCQKQALDLFTQATQDLDKENVVLPSTIGRFASSSTMGIFPALVASLAALGAQVIHMEDAPPELRVSCIKFHVSFAAQESTTQMYVYCGGLDETIETQRMALKSLLKPLQPVASLMRATGYAMFPDVRKGIDSTSQAHFKAMVLAMSSLIVQDDSGIPYSVLARHETNVAVYGEYRGLGDPELSGLSKLPGAVIKSLYQPALASAHSQGPAPFRFGYRSVIGPSGKKTESAEDVFVKRGDFKGSHIIVARKRPATLRRMLRI